MTVNINIGNFWEMLSALGTIGAVIVSLYLSVSKGKPKFYISSSTKHNSSINELEEVFEIVNVGEVPAKVLLFGFTTSKYKFLGKSTYFSGTFTYDSSNKNFRHSNMILAGEVINIIINRKDVKRTLANILDKEKKVYFFVMDQNRKKHYLLFKYSISIER